MTTSTTHTETDRFLAVTQQLDYTSAGWYKTAGRIPIVGSVARSAMDVLHLRARFLVSRTMAEAGVGNYAILKAVVLLVISVALVVFSLSLVLPSETSSISRDGTIIMALIAAVVSLIAIPTIVNALAVIIGTFGHMRGKGPSGVIANSNLSQMAEQNVFSPKSH